MIKNDKGLLIVISGPSGVGKGTVCDHIVNSTDNIFLSVSATTRAPRPGEIEGKNYYFISKGNFEKMIEDDQLFEWANFCGNYYGTPKAPVEEMINKGKNVILEIELQGAMKVREKHPEGVYIFVFPPSFEELTKRLSGRGTESEDIIQKRLEKAKYELSMCDKYNYFVINDKVGKTAEEIKAIITAERAKKERNTLNF